MAREPQAAKLRFRIPIGKATARGSVAGPIQARRQAALSPPWCPCWPPARWAPGWPAAWPPAPASAAWRSPPCTGCGAAAVKTQLLRTLQSLAYVAVHTVHARNPRPPVACPDEASGRQPWQKDLAAHLSCASRANWQVMQGPRQHASSMSSRCEPWNRRPGGSFSRLHWRQLCAAGCALPAARLGAPVQPTGMLYLLRNWVLMRPT
jgi:hypothetical protein